MRRVTSSLRSRCSNEQYEIDWTSIIYLILVGVRFPPPAVLLKRVSAFGRLRPTLIPPDKGYVAP
jgi:hypothetical protein